MTASKTVQVPACDGCSVGVMDETNQHLHGTCTCACHRTFRVGDEVSAFHPRMFGVVCTGRVQRVGRKYLHIDFGELRGGSFRVAYIRVR